MEEVGVLASEQMLSGLQELWAVAAMLVTGDSFSGRNTHSSRGCSDGMHCTRN